MLNFKITIPFLPISGVQVSACVWTSKARASKALNADDNLADPQQTDTSLSQEAQQRVPAGEDCLCQGQNHSQTKRENIQLRWENLHSLGCEANKQGSDRNTSPLSERFATWAQGCDQNDWSHNTSSNSDFYLRSFRANIKTVGNISSNLHRMKADQKLSERTVSFKYENVIVIN